MKFKNYIYFLVSMLLITTQAAAEPSKPISAMMDTPASVFDVYLFRLMEQSKCHQGWFGNSKDRTKLCMTRIDYHFDDNLIEMNFFVQERHEKKESIRTATDKQKEKILNSMMSDLARSVGVDSDIEIDGKIILFGMIQLTPIRHKWSNTRFDEKAAKEEIAKRTIINLRTLVEGFIYTITRDQHGKVTFTKKESPL